MPLSVMSVGWAFSHGKMGIVAAVTGTVVVPVFVFLSAIAPLAARHVLNKYWRMYRNPPQSSASDDIGSKRSTSAVGGVHGSLIGVEAIGHVQVDLPAVMPGAGTCCEGGFGARMSGR